MAPPSPVGLLGLAAVALGCGAPPRAIPPPPSAPVAASPPAPLAAFEYRVTSTPNADELRVEVALPAGVPGRAWSVDPGLVPYVRDVRVGPHGGPSAAPAAGDGWSLPACSEAAGCTLGYRVLLGQAARALGDRDRAELEYGATLSPPSAWMMRPRDLRAHFRLGVTAAPGDSFVSGMALAPGGELFEGEVDALDDTPYAAFGRLEPWRRSLPGGVIDVAFVRASPTPAVRGWVDGALGAVASYYGQFPIPHAALLVRVDPGAGIGGGRTMGHGGGAVLIAVGADTSAAGLRRDWVLVHELVHVSFPEVGSAWAEEGIATYLEPIIRLRAGLCDVDELWRSLVEGLPQGQPEAGDGGLDVTDTWGRRYWGGALFWFVADVRIRERTGNARGLDDVLWAINKAGGNVGVRWPLDRVLAMGDAATGVDVLVPLRAELGATPGRPDLDAMWKRLGVARGPTAMVYDDGAPLAAVRKGIMGTRTPPGAPVPTR